jgi:sulfoxide reductase heme-binding subunit YedZ
MTLLEWYVERARGLVGFGLLTLTVHGGLTLSGRALATALGVVGAELLVALAITNRYRKLLGHRFWRRAHYLSFAAWLLALVHGLLAGSDTGAGWATALYVRSTAAVGGALTWRLAKPLPGAPARAVG